MSELRIERAANITTLGSQEDLNKYLRKHVKLNKEVWDIAWMKKPQLRFKLPMKTGPVNTTVNIIHNRINKAGSTSMMGRLIVFLSTKRSIVCKASCHPVTQSFGHLIIQSLGHSVTWSLGHLLTWSLGHLLTRSLGQTN